MPNNQNEALTEKEVSAAIDDLEQRLTNIESRLGKYIQLNGASKKLKRKAKAYFQEIEKSEDKVAEV